MIGVDYKVITGITLSGDCPLREDEGEHREVKVERWKEENVEL